MSLKDIRKRIQKNKSGKVYKSFTKKFLLGVIFVNSLIIILGVLFIFSYIAKGNDVEVDFSFPEEIARGKPFDFDVSILNSSEINFQRASIYIQLSSGLVFWDDKEERIINENIGNISSKNLVKKHYKIIPVGEENSKENIKVSVAYFNQGNNRFEINKNVEINIKSSAFKIKVLNDAPLPIGSLSSIKIQYINNSGYDFSEGYLKVNFPEFYQFSKASVPYISFDKKFKLGTILNGVSREIEINGIFTETNVKKVEIPLQLVIVLNNKEYLVSEGIAKFNLKDPLLKISILVNNQENYIAKPKDHLVYEINVKNKTNVSFKDVTVKVNLSGFFRSDSIKTDGYYNPSSKTIVWNSENRPSLSFIEPEEERTFKFELNISSQASSYLQSIVNKNLYVRAEVKIESPSLKNISEETFIKTAKETKVGSVISLRTVAYRKDPLGKIESYGPFPFKVGSSSSYVIHWYISNFGNDLSGVKIQALLPQGVKFIEGSGGSSFGGLPYYNPSLNSVIWDVGDLYSGSGLFGGALDGYFGLEITPSEENAQKFVPLLGPTIFLAKDNFTREDLKITKDAVYSNNLSDFSSIYGYVEM